MRNRAALLAYASSVSSAAKRGSIITCEGSAGSEGAGEYEAWRKECFVRSGYADGGGGEVSTRNYGTSHERLIHTT
jgi:hypothetical protein